MKKVIITQQEAKDVFNVLNFGMPDGKIKRMRLVKLSNKLEEILKTK